MKVTAGGPPISVSVVLVDPTASVSFAAPEVALTRVIPVVELSYIEIVVSASMDDSGLYQYKTDMVAVADSAALNFSRPLTDGIATSDSTALLAIKALVDSVGTSDVCIPTLTFLRDFSDAFGAADTYTPLFGKNTADAVVGADAAPIFSISKALADAFAMNDMADIGDGIAFQFDDYTNNVVTMSDGTIVFVAPAYLDSIATADATSYDFSRGVSDSITETDSLAISFSGAYTDSLGLTDNLSNDFSRPLADSYTPSDTAALQSSLVPIDSFALSDAGTSNIQNYVVSGYLAGDYVGTNYTF